jgi:PAS domain S-box-containing protein
METLVQVMYQFLLILLTYSLSLIVNRRLLIRIENEEEKFSRTFHCAPYPIMLSRLSDGKIMEINEAFVHTSGYTRPEVLGKTTLDLHFVESRESLTCELSRSGSFCNVERQFRTKSDEIRTGLVSAGLIHINNEESVLSSIVDITELKRAEDERKQLITELQDALANVKTLSGLLPICSYCKKIRNDEGYWQQLEAYIHQRSEAQFSHGVCPDCYKKAIARLDKELNAIKVAGK